MEPVSNVINRTQYTVAEEFVPPVRFPTPESWYAFVADHPGVPNARYCKYGCGGAGFFRRNVPVGHAHFGKALPCPCKKEQASQLAAGRADEYRAELSNREQSFTLENWVGEDRNALNSVRQFVSQGWGMVCLWGDVGVAKSGLLAAVVNHCLDRSIPALYKVAPAMLDELRQAYQDDSFEGDFNELCGVKVLCLDELWRYKQSEWAQEKIFQLLDFRYRYFDRLLTIVATNTKPDPAHDPLWSRFSDRARGAVIQVTGRDVRPLAA